MVAPGPAAGGGRFYRYLFAALCFSALAAGALLRSPFALMCVLIFGALSRTATKRAWPDPPGAEKIFEYFGRMTGGVREQG